MSDYLFLTHPDSAISTSIAFNRYATISRGLGGQKTDFDVLVIRPNKSTSGWTVIDRLKHHEAASITIHSNSYSLEVGELLAVVPIACHLKVNGEISELPLPINRATRTSSSTSRGSLRFHFGESSSSFQVEFPSAAAEKTDGRMTCFRSLGLEYGPGIRHLALFANLRRLNQQEQPQIRVQCRTKFGLLVREIQFKPNSVGIVEINNQSGNDIFSFSSSDAILVPIFVSVAENDYPQITVEHTHPPAEFFWGDRDRFIGIAKVRSAWT